MIVAMQEHATEEQIDDVIESMTEAGVGVHRTTRASQTIMADSCSAPATCPNWR